MKIHTKPYEEIRKTLDEQGYASNPRVFFAFDMRKRCGKLVETKSYVSPIKTIYVQDWIWHPDWYTVVHDNPNLTSW